MLPPLWALKVSHDTCSQLTSSVDLYKEVAGIGNIYVNLGEKKFSIKCVCVDWLLFCFTSSVYKYKKTVSYSGIAVLSDFYLPKNVQNLREWSLISQCCVFEPECKCSLWTMDWHRKLSLLFMTISALNIFLFNLIQVTSTDKYF